MLRRIESRTGRIALTILLFFVATLVVMVPVGVLGSSNLVWGEDNQYGRVDVPGSAVLHLPAGSVRVSAAVEIPGAGNETADLPLPSDLSLSVSPVSGSAKPVITRDQGSSSNASDNIVNTQRQVWTVQIPRDGAYRVSADGNFLGVGVNPQLWFGHGPPIPGTLVPLVAVGLVLLGGCVWFLILPRITGRRRLPSPVPDRLAHDRSAASISPQSSADPIDRLERLADLRDRGALTDAEFEAEKANVISEPDPR